MDKLADVFCSLAGVFIGKELLSIAVSFFR
jgi:hypothetical protein